MSRGSNCSCTYQRRDFLGSSVLAGAPVGQAEEQVRHGRRVADVPVGVRGAGALRGAAVLLAGADGGLEVVQHGNHVLLLVGMEEQVEALKGQFISHF